MKRMFVGALFLLSAGCATLSPKDQLRADAEARVRGCLSVSNFDFQRHTCFQESKRFCRSNGLEAGCGLEMLFFRPVLSPPGGG